MDPIEPSLQLAKWRENRPITDQHHDPGSTTEKAYPM